MLRVRLSFFTVYTKNIALFSSRFFFSFFYFESFVGHRDINTMQHFLLDWKERFIMNKYQ